MRPTHWSRPAELTEAERRLLRARRSDIVTGVFLALVAVAALVAGSVFGNLHSPHLRPKIVSGSTAIAVLVIGVVATRRLARGLGGALSVQTARAFGSAVRLISTGIGYVIVAFSVLAILDVSIEHLLVGAGLAGVVLGIAAQQSLGNVFAGIVMLLARPFVVGDRVRIRSGALGGIFDATVLEASLTYVTVATDDGALKIPNSVLLAAAIAHLSPNAPPLPTAAPAPRPAPPAEAGGAPPGAPAGH